MERGSRRFIPKELNDFTTGLAYDAYMLYLSPEALENKDYDYETPIRSIDQLQHYKYTRERGFQSEYAISAGANYDDKFYFGITLGIQSLITNRFPCTLKKLLEKQITNWKSSVCTKTLQVVVSG